MKKKNWRKRKYISVRKEIVFIFLLFNIVTIGVFLTIYSHNIKEIRENDLNHLTENNMQLASITNSIITDISPLFQMHYQDTKLRNILSNERMEYSEKNRFENTTYVENMLAHAISGSEYIVRCSIFTNKGDVYSNVSSVLEDYRDYIWNIIKSGKNMDNIYYTDVHKCSIGLVDRNVITAIKVLYNYKGTVPLAWVSLDISYEKLEDLLKTSNVSTGTILMCNDTKLYDNPALGVPEEQHIIIQQHASKMAQEGTKQELIPIAGEKYLVTAIKSINTQWILVRYIAEHEVLDSTYRKQFKDISYLLITVIIVFFIYYYRVNNMMKPLKKLDQVVRNNDKGELEKVYLTPKEEGQIGNNEILTVVKNYNAMTERLNEYTDKIFQYQISQKEAQIKMLTYQINPHFLYNTLNTISAIAEIENMDAIVKITESISNIFRYSLKENTTVSLQEELNHVRDYVQIQRYRFPGRFKVHYNIPKELENVQIMKFILQPLVENSISHGLFEKEKDGEITIEAIGEEDNEYMRLSICDNGSGIEKEELEQLNQKLLASRNYKGTAYNTGADGIGIMNVNARISGYYGSECGIQINSNYGEGTTAIIRLKVEKGIDISESSNCGR